MKCKWKLKRQRAVPQTYYEIWGCPTDPCMAAYLRHLRRLGIDARAVPRNYDYEQDQVIGQQTTMP